MNLVSVVIVAILAAGLGTCSVKAQIVKDEAVNITTSPIMVSPTDTTTTYQKSQNIIVPSQANWTGTVPGAAGGFSGGGTGPAFNSSTNTIIFGYTQGTAIQTITAQAYALQHALDLSNSGVKLGGYNYSWQIDNSGQNSGTLTGAVQLKGVGGNILETFNYNYNSPTDGFELKTGTERFKTDYELLNLQSISLSFTGKDSRFWAGYYGPRVRDPSITMNYTVDLCSANPLSSPSCSGYAAAYLTQQCTGNPLYNSACPGYAEALFTQQCTANVLSNPSCPGYAPAYLTYQCSVNPLYSTTCPGYEQAYFNAQCIRDSLYSNKCEGYATAYAIKYLVTGIDSTVVNQSLSNTAAVKANDPTTVKVATNTASTTINTDGSVSTGVSATGDTNVDKAIASKASTSGNQPAAAVQLTPNTVGAAVAERRQEQKQDDRRAENKPEGGQPQGGPQGGQQDQKSDQPKTARQELQERRQEAAKAKAVEQGKDLANSMGKAADMEQQKQIQNVVIQAMGFTPGFDAYKVMMPDVAGYKPYSVYANQKTVDNRRLGYGLFGPTDNLHKEMVDSQYNRGN